MTKLIYIHMHLCYDNGYCPTVYSQLIALLGKYYKYIVLPWAILLFLYSHYFQYHLACCKCASSIMELVAKFEIEGGLVLFLESYLIVQ